MDTPTLPSANGTGNDRPPRQRSSIPSLLFLSFILFMLTRHNGDELLAMHMYQDALAGLTSQLGNYTAWLNGNASNFNLPEVSPSLTSLVEAFGVYDAASASNGATFYSNITGFINGDVIFHNITPTQFPGSPLPLPEWKSAAQRITADVNMTDLVDRLGVWDWSASNKVAFSLAEKSYEGAAAQKNIALVRGRIELTDRVTGEDHRLEFEAVHFISNGSLYGLVEPAGQQVELRLLPSLVPKSHQNETAHAIVPELEARIAKVQNLIDAGTMDQEDNNNDSPRSRCPFTLYAQLSPAYVPQALMQELEEEIQNPTGVWTISPPKLSLGGILLSKECGILFEIVETEGLKSPTFFRKVNAYASLSALSYLLLLALLCRQRNLSRTPTGVSRVSRWTFLSQAILDSVSFAGHITFAILTDGRASLSLVAPAFLACVLFVYEAQFAVLIHRIQLPEDATPTSTLPPPQNPPGESPPSAAAQEPTRTTPPPPPTLAPQPAPHENPSFVRGFLQHLRTDPQMRMWATLFICLMVIIRMMLSPTVTLFFIGTMYSSMWVPQIHRSVRRGRSSGLTVEYLVGTTLSRLYFALYFLACPKNVLDVYPRSWIYLVAVFMFLQVIVIILQNHLPPAFFLPRRFVIVQAYDYHPPMPLSGNGASDVESPEYSLGDCAICMDGIYVERDGEAGAGRLLSKVGRGVNTKGRKNYSLAPCHHLFHTECLERWLVIKNICPQCRRPLPPL